MAGDRLDPVPYPYGHDRPANPASGRHTLDQIDPVPLGHPSSLPTRIGRVRRPRCRQRGQLGRHIHPMLRGENAGEHRDRSERREQHTTRGQDQDRTAAAFA